MITGKREIHAQITSRMLFEFKAKDPISVVSTVMRKSLQFEKTRTEHLQAAIEV